MLQIPLAYLLAIPLELQSNGVFIGIAISESMVAIVAVLVVAIGFLIYELMPPKPSSSSKPKAKAPPTTQKRHRSMFAFTGKFQQPCALALVVCVHVRTVGPAGASDLADILAAMRGRMGEGVEITWEAVDDIPTTASGKYRFTVSDVPFGEGAA